MSSSMATAAYAQVASGVLSGTVNDPFGAAVSGARVAATEARTGLVRATITDARGNYVIDPIPPGAYTVTAQKAGFREYEASGVTIELNQTARHEIRLALGASQDRVTVSATVSPLDTDSAAVGYRMDQTKIEGVPLAQRTIFLLEMLHRGEQLVDPFLQAPELEIELRSCCVVH